jgi:lipopolysaccharide heptosyltransferase I
MESSSLDPGSLERILIVRLGALGDVVHVLPALSALSETLPSASIDWVVETASSSLLRGHPQIDTLHVLPRKEWSRNLGKPGRWIGIGVQARRILRDLRGAKYDLAVDFQGNLRSGVVTFLSGARARLGFGKGASKENSHLFYTHKVVPDREDLHKVDKNLALLAPLGRRPDPIPAAVLPDAPGGESMEKALSDLPRPVVAVHPGVSRFGALKAYPLRSFSALCRELVSGTGGSVILTYGPGEREDAEAVALEAGPSVRPATESGSLLDLVETFRRVDAVVGVDTGPTQLAGVTGKPVVALYGPKDPVIYRPVGDRVEVVVSDDPALDCIPCNGRRCPIEDTDGFSPCMTSIDPARVARVVMMALGG